MRTFLPVFLALSFCASTSIAGTCPTSSDVYKVFPVAAQPNSASSPSYLVQRVVFPLMIDDVVTMIPLGVPDMVIGATSGAGNYFAQYVSSLPVSQVPQAPATPTSGFKTVVAKTLSGGCPSLLFEKAGASFLVEFNSDGSIVGAQGLDGSSGGVDVGAFAVTVADVNGDGRQDLVLKQGGATRLVLAGQVNGTVSPDDAASATAVWNGFIAACAAGDRALAASYLSDQAAALYGAHLANTGNDITLMAQNIVGQQVSTLAAGKMMSVKVLYLNGADYVAYTNEIVFVNGGWYLQTL